jgi:hypothetical protein
VLTNVVQFSFFQAKNWCVRVGYMDPLTSCSQTTNFDLEPSLCEKQTQRANGPSWTTISYLLVFFWIFQYLGTSNYLSCMLYWLCEDLSVGIQKHGLLAFLWSRVVGIMCTWNFQLSITCIVPIIILGKSLP